LYPVKLKNDGTLEDVYRPSIYLDTNFLRYYYLAEGTEDYVDDEGNEVEPPWASDLPEDPSSDSARREMLWRLIRRGTPRDSSP
jgi:hypothetical protein